MAKKSEKWDLNIAGEFYVDRQCIACDACVVEAPHFFKMNEIEAHAFVYLQPTTKKDFDNCIEALESCPVDAIGKDGNEN